jgi:hypothetical protein
MIHRLGIGIIEMRRIDAFLAARGIVVSEHRNVSEKYFSPATLSPVMRETILSKIEEDLILWRFMTPTLARSTTAMTESYHFAAAIPTIR